MSYVDIANKFHVALNGSGLLLQGAPERPAYAQEQSPAFGNRFASGDRSYNDLSKWWYFVQTDWSGGFKDAVSWEDDARFFFSTNIDTWSEPGSIKLCTGLASHKDCAESVSCGKSIAFGANVYIYLGTYVNAGDSKPRLYKDGTNIISGYIPTNGRVADCVNYTGLLFTIVYGTATTYAVFSSAADGTSQTDHTAAIKTAMGWSTCTGGTALATDGTTLFVGVVEVGSANYGVVKTVDGGANWTKVFTVDAEETICDMLIYGNYLVYLVTKASGYYLHKYDLVNSVDVSIRLLAAVPSGASATASRKFLHLYRGKVVISVPSYEVWELDGDSLTRLIKEDTFKYTTLAAIKRESGHRIYEDFGCVEYDDKLWWSNLMYDGARFYNTKKGYVDAVDKWLGPLFADANYIYWVGEADQSIVYVDSGYKGTADKNYIMLNNFDVISGIDKLAYSITVLFKKLATGQKISVEYFTGELAADSTFTALGNVNFTDDGAVITSKKFLFAVGTTFKKIWGRIKLEGGGSTTPTLTDAVMEYLPIPTPTKLWNLNINCGDEVRRLDGALVETTGRELRSKLEAAWWAKSVLDFQDIDYATTLINAVSGLTAAATTVTVDSTRGFPEAGRIKIDDEEILYTGKTDTTFTGCTRGSRDTMAVAHADDAVVNNAYKVLITDLSFRAPKMNEGRELEYTGALQLMEV